MYRNYADSFDDINWTFVTNAFWGKAPAGTWMLTLRDVYAGDAGTWNSYEVTAYLGDLIAAQEPGSLALLLLGAGAILTSAADVVWRKRTNRASAFSIQGAVDATDAFMWGSHVSRFGSCSCA